MHPFKKYVVVLIITVNSCTPIALVKQGRAMTEKDAKTLLYTYPISDNDERIPYTTEQVENVLLQLLTDRRIGFEFVATPYTDADAIRIRLYGKNNALYTYAVTLYNPYVSRTVLDSIFLNKDYRMPTYSFLSIGAVGDSNGIIINRINKENTAFKNSAIRQELDSLFKTVVQMPLLKQLKEQTNCIVPMVKQQSEKQRQLIYKDTCTKSPLAVYTYHTIAQAMGRYSDTHIQKVEKFYDSFILVDSFVGHNKYSKKILYHDGRIDIVY
jgi:hypothetical protein